MNSKKIKVILYSNIQYKQVLFKGLILFRIIYNLEREKIKLLSVNAVCFFNLRVHFQKRLLREYLLPNVDCFFLILLSTENILHTYITKQSQFFFATSICFFNIK